MADYPLPPPPPPRPLPAPLVGPVWAPEPRSTGPAPLTPVKTDLVSRVQRAAQTAGPREQDLAALVRREAARHGYDPEFGMRMVERESKFDPFARSPQNARGLMQMVPDTAKYLKVTDPTVPNQNVPAGFRYLAEMQRKFAPLAPEADPQEVALAAYNMGETKLRALIKEHGYDYARLPPETQGYIGEIMRGIPSPHLPRKKR